MDWLARQLPEIVRLTGEHLFLAGVSTFIAIAAGLPAGVALVRRPRAARLVLGAASIVQTIPSLALFALLIPLPFLGGIGAPAAIVALVLYSLLPILRNTVDGIRAVDPAVVEAGRGLGMSPAQLLVRVEIPLAMESIVGGIRTAAVISVGTATIAAAVGAGGLGELIFRGVAMLDNRLLLAGGIPAALLALAIDAALAGLGTVVAPRRDSS